MLSRRERRFLALCIILGVVSAFAGAAVARADTDGARLGWFEPVARAAWPASPCAGHEFVHLHADAFMAAVAAQVPGSPGIDGLADMSGPCEIWIRSGLDADRFCVVLVHEFGHLSGRQHTMIPGDVMNGEGDMSWGPCDQAVMAAAAGRSRPATPPRVRRSHRRGWFDSRR